MWDELLWNANSFSIIFVISIPKEFQKFEDKVTYMLRRNSLAIYVWRRLQSKLNTYDNRSYLDSGFAGEATPLHCFDIMNAFNMLREHRQKTFCHA